MKVDTPSPLFADGAESEVGLSCVDFLHFQIEYFYFSFAADAAMLTIVGKGSLPFSDAVSSVMILLKVE